MALPLGFTPLEVRTYLILTLCWVSIVVVNLLEQPYARSLIHCETPVSTEEGSAFSGSKYCGNRLYVIDMGTHVSGKGQSLENVGRILITLFVSGFADYGRKRAALLGQFLITLSTALFAVAMFLPQGLAIPTYILAQGLQGMSGIGILDQIVTGDVALILNDGVGVYSRKGIVSAFLMVILVPIIVYVQYAEITDFTWVWTGIVSLNTFAMVLVFFFFPETLHKKSEKEEEDLKKKPTSIAGVALDEMKTFRTIVKTHPYVGYRLAEDFLVKLADCSAIGMPFMMAQFQFSQFHALVFHFIPQLVGGVLLGGLVASLCRAHGTRKVWQNCFFFHRSTSIMNAFLMPVTIFGIPYPLLGGLMHLPLSGFPALLQAVEIRLVGQETNAKYQAMAQLMGFISGAITSWLYSAIFFGEATSYARIVAPYAVSAMFMATNILPFWLTTGPMQLAECDKLDQEALAEMKKKEEEKAQADKEAETAEGTNEASSPLKPEAEPETEPLLEKSEEVNVAPKTEGLEDVARQSESGSVPLHGRLFAQWMHHVFPRECPYPHEAGTTNPQTPDEWMKTNGRSTQVSAQQIEQIARDSCPADKKEGLPRHCDMENAELPWSNREDRAELLSSLHGPRTQLSGHKFFGREEQLGDSSEDSVPLLTLLSFVALPAMVLSAYLLDYMLGRNRQLQRRCYLSLVSALAFIWATVLCLMFHIVDMKAATGAGLVFLLWRLLVSHWIPVSGGKLIDSAV